MSMEELFYRPSYWLSGRWINYCNEWHSCSFFKYRDAHNCMVLNMTAINSSITIFFKGEWAKFLEEGHCVSGSFLVGS